MEICRRSERRATARLSLKWMKMAMTSAEFANVFIQVPIGTYTGWNLFNNRSYEDGFCTLTGSFIPFASTMQERLATGDPRRSLEERYPDKDAYVAAIKKAAESLVKQRFLLPDDAATLIKQAEDNGIRQGP